MVERPDFRSLQILDRFRGLVERTGADYDMLRLILQVKFQMDGRRVPTILSGSRAAKENKDGNMYIRSLWFYALMGIIMVPFMIWDMGPYILSMSIVTAMLMFIIMTSMVSDFSAVLLDIRDRNIILTKPVNARTVGLARAIHAGVYLLLLTGSLTAAPLVAAFVKHGIIFFVIFLVELILMVSLVLVSTSLVYLFMMRFLDGERLRDMINTVQIALSISIAVGYQLVIRSFSIIDTDMVYTPDWWQMFLPPVWYASAFEWLLGGGGNAWIYVFTALGVLVPMIGMFAYVKLMPSFELYLEKMAHSGQTSKRKRGRWDRRIAQLLCRSREEQACFRLSANMMRNEREFKLKVYPSIGLSFVLPYVFWLTYLQSESWGELRQSSMFYTMYIMLFLIMSVVLMLKFSGNYKAFWSFRAAPLAHDGVLYSAALKAFATNMFLPMYLLNAVVFGWTFGWRIVPDLIVILLTALALIPPSGKLLLKQPPFSQSFSMAQQSDGWIILAYLPVIGLLWGLHAWVRTLPAGIWIYLAILLVANVVLWTVLYRPSSGMASGRQLEPPSWR
ncbi:MULTISPECIES: hypothetical protein [Paenibacillus]|uniref:hypothetical protein n=1 Tax=Paenibacillus TaxID=44249 RepID=UPI001F30B212|nr:hypothetical protein [Paenibacillus sp. JJ-223]CAH1196683.1 hypothetical protein PAECIP111890_00994 [Paenibacillus sp. JJ-223]